MSDIQDEINFKKIKIKLLNDEIKSLEKKQAKMEHDMKNNPICKTLEKYCKITKFADWSDTYAVWFEDKKRFIKNISDWSIMLDDMYRNHKSVLIAIMMNKPYKENVVTLHFRRLRK